jgi:hypothetical protein
MRIPLHVRLILSSAAVALAGLASVVVPGGFASAAEPENCHAVYELAGPKVAGQPTDLKLKEYSCGGDVSTMNWTVMKAWEDIDYKGASVDFSIASGEECNVDGWRWTEMPTNWNDRISSFRAYGTCQGVRLYNDTNTSGSPCGSYLHDVSWVNVMNDIASSMRNSSEQLPC